MENISNSEVSKVFKQTVIIEVSRFIPSMNFKVIYTVNFKMTVGQNTAFAYKVLPDFLSRVNFCWQ